MEDIEIKNLLLKIGSFFIDLAKDIGDDQNSPMVPEVDPEIKQRTLDQIQALKPTMTDLIFSPAWPKATEEDVVIKTEDDKYERADAIIGQMIEQNTDNLRFLDFGCGEGHVAKNICQQTPKVSVGYDLNLPANQITKWETKENNFLLTNDLTKVVAEGPYDVCLLYDVLDHVEDPIEVLNILKTITTPTTKIYVRCHPWCSRHGGHLYHKINKAFAHLFISSEDYKIFTNEDAMFTQRILYPGQVYENWFTTTGYKWKSENIERNLIESFFTTNKDVKNEILKIWGRTEKEQFPRAQMEQTFLDYTLQP